MTEAADAIELGLPVQCTIGQDCFVQQFADMDPGPGAVDPFCGIATNDEHTGLDLRVLSMADVERGVPVLALADGQVQRVRDGVPDRLVETEADRAAVASMECGNGVVVDHGDNVEVQYCHLRQGSVLARLGDRVVRGQPIGQVGASGLAQFPHVHLTVRRASKDVDPLTGRELSDGCLPAGEKAAPLFTRELVAAFGRGEPQIISLGVAGHPVEHDLLTVSGAPASANKTSVAVVAWGWAINLRQGDRMIISLSGPSGNLAQQRTEPMDRSKASYAAFAGKRGSPAPGAYEVTIGIERDGAIVISKTLRHPVH